MKIRLLILDDDQRYLSRLVNTLRASYAAEFEIFEINNLEMAMEIACTKKISVFLAAEDMDVDTKQLPSRCAFAYLSETSGYATIRDENAIGKYQKVSAICKEIQLLAASTSQYGVINNDGSKARIAVFASPAGGVGTSTLAISYATFLVNQGMPALYVNLQKFFDTSLYFDCDGKYTLENVFYELLSEKKNMSYNIMHMTQKASTGVSFFETPKHAATMRDIDFDSIKSLIKVLTEQSEYPVVVIDVDYSIEPDFISIIEKADSFIVVSDGSAEANSKIDRAFSALTQFNSDIIGGISVGYNRFSSKNGREIENDEIRPLKGIGKIEGAPVRELVKEISKKNVFADFV